MGGATGARIRAKIKRLMVKRARVDEPEMKLRSLAKCLSLSPKITHRSQSQLFSCRAAWKAASADASGLKE
jgi:hypothetical protein